MLTPSYDIDRIRLRVLSLGAGVQSTTLALMAAHGEVTPMPDLAVFADTGWEPARVYEHLQWLASDNVLPFAIHVVSAGNIRDGLLRGARGERWASIPAFTRTVTPAGTRIVHYEEDADGEKRPVGQRVLARDEVAIGMITRQCTTEYKLEPIRRHVRILAGLSGLRAPGYPVVEQWIGISTDEAIRMKPSFQAWQVNRWPLLEKRMSRSDCLIWLRQHGYPIPPKSACLGCPFHSNARWRQIRDEDPAGWADAVEADRSIRTGFRGMRAELYLHRSCVPLDQADLSDDSGQLDLWPLECEGMCGV
ncbi:hypothetical protein [Chelativorans sp. AA-79]|uniref:hypothetical protein n=1 Tax=Chelativorans sp. AA-79 TaxID=3028735 RepID=UPI0023F70B7B|nr:hypothetical protein [Chelativorans sp. AA-79]WEX12382.1 hypothetical protein PVE73_27200 [Chelativorans sp. AA-79]